MRTSLAVSLAIWAASVGAARGHFSPFLVKPVGGGQHNPDVSGTVVVWVEYSDGDSSVRGKDVATGKSFLVDEPAVRESGPVIDGDLVVWGDNRAGNFDIFARDLVTGEELTIVDEPHGQGSGAVGGGIVVWHDTRNSPTGVPPEFSNWDIYAFDIQSGREFAVSRAAWDQRDPAISGDIIVWEDHRAEIPGFYPTWGRIYGYDVTTGREFLIAADDGGIDQVKPAISGSIVVWVEMRVGSGIWGHDLDSNTTFPIHVGPYSQNDADIDGRYVVWEDSRSGTDQDIWGYDLLTGEEFPIYRGPGNQADPSISGNLVVWESHIVGEDSRIWGAYIPEPATAGLLALAFLPWVGRRPRAARACGRKHTGAPLARAR